MSRGSAGTLLGSSKSENAADRGFDGASGRLYICATPIGNLKDVTIRVLETLAAVDLIAAEDTRRTRKLLTHFDIKNKLISFHDRNEVKVLPRIMAELRAGKSVAQVSDAGLPGIADPGHRLVKACVEEDIPFDVLPGASAVLTAAVLSGLPTDDMRFHGYFPRKAGARRRLLTETREDPATLIFYESPHRLKASLEDIAAVLGDRPVFVGRELTKLFEERLRGSAELILTQLADREIKGELVVAIAGARPEPRAGKPLGASDIEHIREAVEIEIAAGRSKSEAIKVVSAKKGLPKRSVYAIAHGSAVPQ